MNDVISSITCINTSTRNHRKHRRPKTVMKWLVAAILLVFGVMSGDLCHGGSILVATTGCFFGAPPSQHSWRRMSTRRRRQRRQRSSEAWFLPTTGTSGMASCTASPQDDDTASFPSLVIVPSLHHAALKTRNITTAIQFYGLLGYRVQTKFRTGPARAAWLELTGSSSDGSNNSTSISSGSAAAAAAGRLELLEVPGYMLPPQNGSKPPPRALNLMAHPALLGYNHVALDVTAQVRAWNRDRGNTAATTNNTNATLQDWMDALDDRSLQQFNKTMRVALPPFQQRIGSSVYELAFVYDADGCLVEFMHCVTEGESAAAAVSAGVDVDDDMESGWKP